ncbi:hypothetical protein [Clostridium ganghwense]|uniref:DUF2202 domain-containing protein n=1 Tax=Clostridium ganghwense TaxID=312089 RepID=A0ABT4CQV1_9CLOT|nr:hypothetical protein [Clostridium ganghwense]MCY6371430.1 hypothetical protein [Clostridium ganghwense]
MKSKWVTKGIIGILLCTLMLGIIGCQKKMDKEPIGDENAVPTVKTLQKEKWGVTAAKEDENLNVEKMLTYAIENEYLEKAKYEAMIRKFGEIRPFIDLAKAKNINISILKTTFQKYKLSIPKDRSREFLKVPETIEESFEISIADEIENMAMYNRFIRRKGVPQELILILVRLRDASRAHLQSLEVGLKRVKE